MIITRHASQRMNHRGIPRDLIELALHHGRIEGDRYVFDRNEARRLVEELKRELRIATRALDKGGVEVVTMGDKIVSAWNSRSRRRPTQPHTPFPGSALGEVVRP